MTTILKNCKLVPELTEGYDPQSEGPADLLLEDGKIAQITRAGKCAAKGETMDMGGNTVMPGLLDLHMHLYFTTMNILAMKFRGESQSLIDGMRYGMEYLSHGVTTVRDCGSDYNSGVMLRNLFASGLVMGPRVIAAGRCNTPTAPGNAEFGTLYKMYDDPADARRIVREDLENGCDFVKYMATGAVMNQGGDPGAMICTYAELKALSDAAKENNTYVAAHCHGVAGIKACTEAEIGSIEHASYIDDECIELLLRHNNVTFIIPTLTVAYSMAEDLNGDTPGYMHERTKQLMDHINEYMVKAYHAGIRMGWGTDSDRITFNQFPGLEFTARSKAGFNNTELLKMATIDSAKLIKMDDRIGTVKAGKLADLICVEGDPKADLTVMNKLPLHVFKEGRLFQMN